MDAAHTPKTLQQAVEFFAVEANAINYMKAIRFPNGLACPTCGSQNVAEFWAVSRRKATQTRKATETRRHVFQCREGHKLSQFTLKTGTIFGDSPLPLKHWLLAMWMLTNCKNGVSSYEVARALGVTQKTAWFMLGRLRLAIQDKKTGGKLGGDVEADETFIGGKARFMHASKRERVFKGRQAGLYGKAAVLGVLERTTADRSSRVRLEVVPNVRRRNLQFELRKHVQMDGKTTLYTDALKSYAPVTPKCA